MNLYSRLGKFDRVLVDSDLNDSALIFDQLKTANIWQLIEDPRVQKLADDIIEAQQRAIKEMQVLIEELK